MDLHIDQSKLDGFELNIPFVYAIGRRVRSVPFRLVFIAIACGLAVGLLAAVTTGGTHGPALFVGALAAPVLALLIMMWPDIGILALLGLTSGLVDVDVLPLLSLGPLSLRIPDLVLIFLLALSIARATTQPSPKALHSPLTLPLLLFLGALCLATYNAIQLHGLRSGDVIPFTRQMFYWIAFFPVVILIRDERTLERFLKGLLLLTAILGTGLLFPNVLSGLHLLPQHDVTLSTAGREFSTINRVFVPSERVFYVMIPVVVCILALVHSRRALWSLALLLLLGNWLLQSFQRNYWLTTALNCAVVFVILGAGERVRLFRRLAPLVLAAAALVLVLIVPVGSGSISAYGVAFSDRIVSLLNDPGQTDDSIIWRLTENQWAFAGIASSPIIGIGLATPYRPRMEAELYDPQSLNWYLHNVYLWIALAAGAVGLIPFLWLCGAYLIRLVRHRSVVRSPLYRAFYLGFGAAFVGTLVSNLVAPNLLQNWTLVIYPIMLATCEVIYRVSEARMTPTIAPESPG